MTTLIEAFGLGGLTDAQKLQLSRELIDAAGGVETPPALLREIERREAEYDADPTIGIPWETVFDEAIARVRK